MQVSTKSWLGNLFNNASRKSRRRRAATRRRLGLEHLERKIVLSADPMADYNVAIQTAQATFANSSAAAQATFQAAVSSDQAAFDSDQQALATSYQNTANADQSLEQGTEASATSAENASDNAADQTDLSQNQAADALMQQQITQAQQDEANADVSDVQQFQTVQSAAAAQAASELSADQAQYDSATAADQSAHDSAMNNDVAGYNTQVAADEAQMQQSENALDANLQAELNAGAAANSGLASSVDTNSVLNDPNYLAVANSAGATLDQAITNGQSAIDNGNAQADATQSQQDQAAKTTLASDQAAAADAYNTATQNAQSQYGTAIAALQATLNGALAADLTAYNTASQNASGAYNSSVETAANTEAASKQAADNAYNAAAQPVIDGYNSWYSQRTTDYNNAIAARDAQEASQEQNETNLYNQAIAADANTENSAISVAQSNYGAAVNGFSGTRTSEDQAAWQSYNNSMQSADNSLGQAQNTYNQTVMMLQMQAQQSGQPVNQAALDAAYNTLLTAKHNHANSAAGAATALTSALGSDAVEFETKEGPAYVTEANAIAAAIAGYAEGVASAQHTMDDHIADDKASDQTDDASTTAAYAEDVAQHYSDEQLAIAVVEQTRQNAYVDAEKQFVDDQVSAWQTMMNAEADAKEKQDVDDVAAQAAFETGKQGPWKTLNDSLAAAAKKEGHDLTQANVTYNDSLWHDQDQDLETRAAVFATVAGQLVSAVETYIAQVAPAWAAALTAASGNDPGTAQFANAWAGFMQQQVADDANTMTQKIAIEDAELTTEIGLHDTLVQQVDSLDLQLADQLGAAAVAQEQADATAMITEANAIIPAAVSLNDNLFANGRTEVTGVINADVQDANSHATNDAADAKEHVASLITWGQVVLPAVVSAVDAICATWAADMGQADTDAANKVKDTNAKGEQEADNIATDWQQEQSSEATAGSVAAQAITAGAAQVANGIAQATQAAIAADPDSDFAGESTGSRQQPQQTQPATAQQIAENSGANPQAQENETLGKVPRTWMLGVTYDAWLLGGGGNATANIGFSFNSWNPLDWEFGVVNSYAGGVKAFANEANIGVAVSVSNAKSFEQLNGVSATLTTGVNAGPVGGNVSIGNLDPIGAGGNLRGEQPTVVSAGISTGTPNAEPIEGGGTIGTSYAAGITGREAVTFVTAGPSAWWYALEIYFGKYDKY